MDNKDWKAMLGAAFDIDPEAVSQESACEADEAGELRQRQGGEESL